MQVQDQPLVTALITTRNRAALLNRAVQSVLKQTYSNLEVVIVDDGSEDETPDVVEELRTAHPQIRTFRNEASAGAPAARNRGIREARGSFIAGLDDDDEWHPERVARLMKAYRSEYSCVTSDVWIDDGRRTIRWKKPRLIDLDDLLLTNVVGNQVLAERERLLAVGGFDESLKAAQDYDLWVRLCQRFGPIRNLRIPLQTIHMAHADRITASPAQTEGYLQFYRKHREAMTPAQRRYQLYAIRRKAGRRMSFGRTLAFVPPKRWLKELKAFALERMPKIR